jgi:hypothetical protein
MPENTVLANAAPENTVPENTVPENTAPENTVPENTAPADTAPRGVGHRARRKVTGCRGERASGPVYRRHRLTLAGRPSRTLRRS